MTELQTAARIDWRDTFQGGLGLSAPSGQLMRCAIEDFAFPPPEDTVSKGFKAVMIDSQEKASQLIDTSATAGFNAFGVEGDFSAAWRKEMSYGSRQVTILLQGWIEWRAQVVSPGSIHLTKEAKAALEKDPAKFRRAYGDYFIAGHQRKARFFVVYRLEAHDEHAMSEFKANAKVSGYDAFAEASVALASEAEKHSLKVDCVGIQEGVRDEGAATLPLKPEQVLQSYESFTKRAVGVPCTAILYHYSLVDPEVACAIDVEPEVLVAVKSLFLRLWDCTASLQGVPDAYRRDLADRLNRLRDNVEARVPRSLNCSVEAVERLAAELDDWCSRFAEVQMYQQLWARLKAMPVVASGNNSATGQTYWKCGVTGGESVVLSASALSENTRFPGQVAPSPDVREIYNKRYQIDWHVGHRTWRPVVSEPKFRICGYEVIANKGDDGSWSVVGGGLSDDNLSLAFGSDYDRGIDWTVRVWGIPAEHVDFDGVAASTGAAHKQGFAKPVVKAAHRDTRRTTPVAATSHRQRAKAPA